MLYASYTYTECLGASADLLGAIVCVSVALDSAGLYIKRTSLRSLHTCTCISMSLKMTMSIMTKESDYGNTACSIQ